MPPPPGSSDPDLWVNDLPAAKETSAGSVSGCRIAKDGSTEHIRDNEDRYYTCKLDGVQLYMVLDGHNGSRACDFAKKRIPSILLQTDMGENGERAAEVLRYTFQSTEEKFFMMLDPSITRKMGLQMEMQEKGGTTSMLAYSMFPEKVEELQRLEEQISGGTTAVVAVVLNSRQLWVANVGDSRAVLCYQDGLGKLHAEQISEDHNTTNEKEIERLVRCGLDEVRLRSSGRLGVHQNTRSIGDYSIKGGFKDHDILSTATKEPGTAEPFISHPPLDITTIRGFLLLMSDGLYDAHATVTNSLHTVNHDLALLVQRHLDHAPSINEVADKVIAEVATNFCSTVQRRGESARMDDITLIIRNLGYPVGQLSGNITSPPMLQNKFSFSQTHQEHPQLQSVAGGPKPHYENSPFLQSMPVPTSSVHSSTNPSTPTSSSRVPYYTSPQAHPSVHVSHHVPVVDAYPPNSVYRSQQSGHYPHPTTGHNAQYGTRPPSQQQHQNGAGAASQGFGDSRADHTAHTDYQDQGHYGEYSNPDSMTTTPAIYENWDLRKRSDRHGSGSSGVTELTGNLATMSVDPSQSDTADPNPSKSPNPGPSSHEPSSNVDYQFQSPQNAGPVSSETNVTVNRNGSTDNTGGVARVLTDDSGLGSSGGGGGGGENGTSGSISRHSTTDDESWMYNDRVLQASKSTQSASSSLGGSEKPGEEEEEEEERRRKDRDTTEVVELELVPENETTQLNVKEEEEENGMIKPIIKFDKFPPDLSWDQI